MAISEFELIDRFLAGHTQCSDYTRVGIGDDAAVLSLPSECELVTSIDVLNVGVHFPEETNAYDIGYKALAVSLSDIAAMGGQPFSVLLSLSLPQADPKWMAEFAQGFFTLAKQHKVDLVGGDVTRGPLSIGTVVNGLVPRGQALLRSNAKPDDLIYVTGTLGDAGLALSLLKQGKLPVPDQLLKRLFLPTPRVKAGLLLRGIASSAIDISDGVLADLEKLTTASHLGAEIKSDALPISSLAKANSSKEQMLRLALTAGDDYELLFTVSESDRATLEALELDTSVSCIGKIKLEKGVLVKDNDGRIQSFESHGYDHFKEALRD